MTTPIPFSENVPLKNYCTFGIGGPARLFFEIHSIEEMQQALQYCQKHNLHFFPLGKGSNCLFDDRGFNGAVMLNKIDFMQQPSPGTFRVGAGYSFALLGIQTARQGWGGLEFASGIPATVGGAVFMNAGANGKETCETLDSVEFAKPDGSLHIYHRKELSFSYRHSPFQQLKGVIVAATFILSPHQQARKQQIEIVNHRIKTQPYSDKSAGCVFMNPPDDFAGALIDKCGLKGTQIGGAAVSNLHANFLINAGKATCQEMLELMKLVRTRVKEASGKDLRTEVRYVPYEE